MNLLQLAGLATGVLAAPALASDLSLRVESGGANVIDVSPGATITYAVVGELSDNPNQGLAMFTFDLAYSAGALAQADDPAALSTLDSFSRPEGVNNPAGFGGTPSGGDLLQVGGAQNTINNVFGAYPLGGVLTGVAANGSPEVLATGSVTVPEESGTYLLSAFNLQANVIRLGETGVPHWAVDRTAVGPIVNLVIHVVSLEQDASSVGLAAGGSSNFTLDAGLAHAGQIYWLVGSMVGTAPGLLLPGGLTLPLNTPDGYFTFTVTSPNTPVLTNSLNLLSGSGTGTASFNLPPGTFPILAGLTVSHAFMTLGPLDFVSNPVTLVLLP